MSSVRILIADDHPVVRKGLRAMLQAHAGWKVVGEAENGTDAVAKARQLEPDVVILDISMPGLNGFDASREITKAQPSSRVLMFTMHRDQALIGKSLHAGARGYVLKTEADRDLFKALETVMEGRTFLPPDTAGALMDMSIPPDQKESRLSSREIQVLHLLAEGKRNREIAAHLGISRRTAENHRAKIMHKLNANSLSDLVRYAIRNNMLCV
jgi:DNA-binding NarL/FixJ family response regulator